MRSTPALLTLCIALAGCAGEAEQDRPISEAPEQDTTPVVSAEPEYEWAAELINNAAEWKPVTEKAVPAHQMNFGLCRLPIPGVDDHGPHNAYTFADLHGDDRDKTPKSPANQFIVNPIGRSAFYNVSDDALPAPLPVGTVIIKEKYNQIEDANKRANPHSFGVMIKHEPGYNPEQGDWEYAYIEMGDEMKITGATRGKLATCIDCHANRKAADYVFRNYPLMDLAE